MHALSNRYTTANHTQSAEKTDGRYAGQTASQCWLNSMLTNYQEITVQHHWKWQHQSQLHYSMYHSEMMANPCCGSDSSLDAACISAGSDLTAELCGSWLVCGELPVCWLVSASSLTIGNKGALSMHCYTHSNYQHYKTQKSQLDI